MRQIISPIPQHQILILGARAVGETGHEDTGDSLGGKSVCHLPGRWFLSGSGKGEPSTRHVAQCDVLLGTALVVPQIGNVLAIDVIAA